MRFGRCPTVLKGLTKRRENIELDIPSDRFRAVIPTRNLPIHTRVNKSISQILFYPFTDEMDLLRGA
jgi:hypothetical protein